MPRSSTSAERAGLIGLERLRLATGAVETRHELGTDTLPERMLGYQGFELADQLGVAAAGEVLLDALLEADQTELLEPSDLGLREAQVGRTRPAAGRATATGPRRNFPRVTRR